MLRSGDTQPPMPLAPGVYGLTAGTDGDMRIVDDPQADAVLTIDRRGSWLQVNATATAVHVNGRPVRRVAMLRAGDVLHVGSAEARLEGRVPEPVEPNVRSDPGTDSVADARAVLRGVGGLHHGRSFSLASPCVVGSGADAQIRIDRVSGHVGHHARVERLDNSVLLRDLGAPEATWVNGHPVRSVLLRPGDQLVFEGRHRFVLDMPGGLRMPEPMQTVMPDTVVDDAQVRRGSKLPWVLLAAVVLAALLALLLWGGGGIGSASG